MKTRLTRPVLAASLLLAAAPARAEAPLAEPLANFDKLVSQLKVSSVVGEPIRVGDTAVVPFVAVRFGLGGGQGPMVFGGGMSAKTVPLGILIVEGDDVRAESIPEPQARPALVEQFLQAILDRRVVFMGNGVNLGQTSGSVQDLAPLISEMMGGTTVVGNALNLGALSAGGPAASSARSASLDEIRKLFAARKYADALALADALLARDPKSPDAHVWKGRILTSLGEGNAKDGGRYASDALEEFEKALALVPDDPDAHLGRGMLRLTAPGGGGDLDGAIADLEAAVAKKPSAEGYYYLGEAFRRQGQNARAAVAYQKSLELQPDHPGAAKALGGLK